MALHSWQFHFTLTSPFLKRLKSRWFFYLSINLRQADNLRKYSAAVSPCNINFPYHSQAILQHSKPAT